MPSVKINNTTVGKIQKPEPGARAYYWDTELKGFGIAATSSGLSYIVQRRIGGRGTKAVRHVVGKHPEISAVEARTKAAIALSSIRVGTDLNAEKEANIKRDEANAMTLAQLFKDYSAKRELRPRTKQTYEDALRLCIPDWCSKPITTITRDMVETRLSEIAGTPGPRGDRKAQAAQCFTLLRALFRFAADRYEVDGVPLIQSLPTRNVARGKSWSKIPARDNIITEVSLPGWYQATSEASPVFQDYIQLLMFSGMRRTEAIKLKWTDIDRKAKVITVRPENSKSGRKRQIPITPLLQEVIERRHACRKQVNPFVFEGSKPGTHMVEPKRAVAAVCKKAGIQFCLHDLRRTYIAHATRLISYPAVKALAGHSTESSNDVTLKHYARLDLESLRQEAEKVAAWFAEKCAEKKEEATTTTEQTGS
jgi:integrase